VDKQTEEQTYRKKNNVSRDFYMDGSTKKSRRCRSLTSVCRRYRYAHQQGRKR